MIDDFIREITDLRCENSSLKYKLKKQKEINRKAIELMKRCKRNYGVDNMNTKDFIELLSILNGKEDYDEK